MSIESAKAYIERLKTDEGFREKVKAAKDQEARMALVKAEGFDFTRDEVSEVEGKLSDEDVDDLGGGGGWKCYHFYDFCTLDINNY